MKIRQCRPEDCQAISEIYNHYIENTVISFEAEPVTASEMAQRLQEVEQNWPWLIATVEGRVVGYAYAAPWHSRVAYRFTVETTIYLHPSETGRGYGCALYSALLDELKRLGCRVAVAGIAMPNDASVRLQEMFGFTEAGRLNKVGYKHGQWIDVGYWQKLFVE